MQHGKALRMMTAPGKSRLCIRHQPVMDKFSTYIKELARQFATGNATEHTYRPALKTLLEAMIPGVLATNEPKHIECGAPDFVLTCKGIPFGYVEAKDIGIPLDAKDNKQQITRYSQSLDNLIYTDYLEFRLIRDGKQVTAVKIAEVSGKQIKPNTANFADLTDLIQSFAEYHGQTITSANDLAKRMAMKARLLASVITQALTIDDRAAQSAINQTNNDLQGQLQAFRKYLIHDIEPANFADIYAQTVAYGMFAARLHDLTPATFSRQEAADLIPETNPFRRNFFQQIAGFGLDKRIRWIVDDLADVFRATYAIITVVFKPLR